MAALDNCCGFRVKVKWFETKEKWWCTVQKGISIICFYYMDLQETRNDMESIRKKIAIGKMQLFTRKFNRAEPKVTIK